MTKYSFIIATFNRLEELKELFYSITLLDFDCETFEVVIIDDGSTDDTREFIDQLDTQFKIQYYHQKNQGPGAARNLGMSKAKGEFFIFIDSDVLLPSNYLAQIDQYLSKKPVDAFGGPDDAHESFSPLLKAINYSMTSFLGTGGTRGSKKSIAKFYPRSFNMGIHRRVFNKIGGMGGLRHGQDMDYSARIYKADFSVSLIPDAVVYHKRRTSLWRFFKQIFNWGVARINLGRKHEGMLKFVHLLPFFIVLGVVFLILVALLWQPIELLNKLAFGVSLTVVATAFVQSFTRYRNIKIAMLSIVTLFIQVFAYGLGTLSALIQVALGKKTATGITKNYYK